MISKYPKGSSNPWLVNTSLEFSVLKFRHIIFLVQNFHILFKDDYVILLLGVKSILGLTPDCAKQEIVIFYAPNELNFYNFSCWINIKTSQSWNIVVYFLNLICALLQNKDKLAARYHQNN